MQVISLKDYAKNNNISYEAVRKQVVRYAAELGEHLIRDGRQQFLDEEAVAFLDEKRKKNPVVLYEIAKDEEIERLEQQNKEILLRLAAVQDQLIREQEKNRFLIEENSKIALLEADNEAARMQISEAQKRASEAESALTEIQIRTEQAESEAEEEKKKSREAEERATAAERAAKTAEDIAEMTAQEAEEEKQRFLLQLEEKEKENAALIIELEELQNRGFWARLFNKTKDKQGENTKWRNT